MAGSELSPVLAPPLPVVSWRMAPVLGSETKISRVPPVFVGFVTRFWDVESNATRLPSAFIVRFAVDAAVPPPPPLL